jgi:formylglycine-generating enzyme required for sulfatase activity
MDLPTEAQWEYAARSRGKAVAHATNNGDIEYGVNYRDPTKIWHTMPVGSWPPNPLGLYDMTGNVDEWTLDLWHLYTTQPPYNPSYVDKSNQPNEYQRVTRGSGITGNLNDLKLYRRIKRDPDKSYSNAGFRCAVNHEEPTINKEKIARQSDLFLSY